MSEAVMPGEIEDVLSSIRRLVSDEFLSSTAAPMPPIAKGSAETGDMSPDMPPAEHAAAMWEDVPPIDAYAAEMDPGLVETVAAPAEAEIPDLPPPDLTAPDLTPPAFTPPGAMTEDRSEAPPDLAPAGAAAVTPLPGWAQHNAHEEEDDTRADPWADTATAEPDAAWADAAEAAALRELDDPGQTDRPADMPTGGATMGGAPMGATGGATGGQMSADFQGDGFDEDIADQPVDEEMLREIVRDVLREELQGRLGERITRNIRKLVRAEIARMMTSDELI